MTREEAIKMAKADLKCMERDTSGQDEMCNSHKCDGCSLNYERGNMGEQKEWLRLAIQALEQEPKWIPVTERLPKEGGDYLVTLSLYVGGKEPAREIRKDFYCILSKKWLYNNDYVTAWMPLPQPYKAESEDKR